MTQLLKKALEAVSTLPPEEQDAIASAILCLAGHGEDGAIELTPEEHEALAASEAEADHGSFASGEDVRAVWAKHGL
mgnify:CR=1 FL=1